jgi:hypothetical protein
MIIRVSGNTLLCLRLISTTVQLSEKVEMHINHSFTSIKIAQSDTSLIIIL